MNLKPYSLRFWGGLLVVVLGSIVLVLAALAHGPDLNLSFEREIRSKYPIDQIGFELSKPTTWKEWFHSLTEAQMIDISGKAYSNKDQYLAPGAVLRLYIDPKHGKWKKFELTTQVMEYIPNRLFRLKVLDDSSGKLNQLFDDLEWTVELIPQSDGTLIRGEAHAHTCHWRSRLFGKLSERILMNQVYYPNLFKLSELDPKTFPEIQGAAAQAKQ